MTATPSDRDILYEVATNGRWSEGEQRGEWMITKEVYETARDALASRSLEREAEWLPIETAPQDGTRVLIFVPGKTTWFEESTGKTWPIHYCGIHAARFESNKMGRSGSSGMWVAGGDLWVDEDLAFTYAQPTHWMPLPEPPRALAQQPPAGETTRCPHCLKVRVPGVQCCQGGF